VLIYGREYWNRIINFQAFVDAGTVSPQDMNLFHFANTPEEGFEFLRDGLTKYHLGGETKKAEAREVAPDIAKTRP
jgi:predicted Rossmann-fold nucleotide-binding protein